LVRALNLRWLIDDRVAEAEERLRQASWTPPDAGFHVQHFYELQAELELYLYRGEGARAELACRDRIAAYRSSLLPRLVACRAMATWLDARLDLARGDGHRIERFARRLDNERLGSTRAWSLLIRGTAAHLARDSMRALELLAAAQAHCEAQGMAGYARAAQKRRGQIMGGEAGATLTHDADSWLRAQGVVNPDRYADLYAPGFSV
jgi:hypothetical protein